MTTSRVDELVCFAVYSAANSTVQAYRQVLAPWDLTYTQFLVLVVLAGDDRTVTAIGQDLGLDSGTLSPLLSRLETRGMVTRRRRDRDERVVTVSLTEDGRRTHDAVTHAVTCLTPAFAGASPDPTALIGQLQELTRSMKQLTHDLRDSRSGSPARTTTRRE